MHLPNKKYDLVTILAYDQNPMQFKSFIEQQVRNQKIVALCNDGAFGGSFVFTAKDDRNPDWITQAMPEGLPRGDSVLVVDVDTAAKTVQVGTANPRRAFNLVRLASITYEKSSHYRISCELKRIAAIPESSVRSHEMQELLKSGNPDKLHSQRIQRLNDQDSRGIPSDAAWSTLGQDCVIGNLERLSGLEKALAKTCTEGINSMLSAYDLADDSALVLVRFQQECQKRIGGSKTNPFEIPSDTASAVFNREDEVRRILQEIDKPGTTLLEIRGLQEIGKSSIITKALTQHGFQSIIRIKLLETSSTEYLVQSIIQAGTQDDQHPVGDPLALMETEAFRDSLQSKRVVIIESAHHLLNYGAWRDDRLPELLSRLAGIAGELSCTVLLETRVALPLEMPDPSRVAYLRVFGLDGRKLRDGIALFDAQLRRNDLSPNSVSEQDKEHIVKRLGGHPLALAYAANVVANEGLDELVSILREKRGFFKDYVAKLLKGLGLSKEERKILKLAALARNSIERTVLSATADFSANPIVQNLIGLSALELDEMNLVRIAGILREFLDPKTLSEEETTKFHTKAAESFSRLSKRKEFQLRAQIEAEFHSRLAGICVAATTGLPDAALGAAEKLYSQQRYSESREIVEQLLKKQETLDLLRLAAKIAIRTNNFREGVQYAKKVLTRNPKDTRLLSEMTKIALTQWQTDELAEDLFQTAKQAGVAEDAVLVARGRVLLRKRKFVEAERAFRQAAKLTTGNPWPFFYLGRICILLGHLDDAIEILCEGENFCTGNSSRNRHAYNAIRGQLALAYIFSGETELAEKIIESLVEEDSPKPEILRINAALQIKKLGIQKAHLAWRRLSEESAKSRHDKCLQHLFMALFYLETGDRYKASEEFSKAHNADQSNVFVLMKWARTKYDIGRSLWLEQSESYRSHLETCASLVRKILRYDDDNSEAIALLQDLREHGIRV